MVIKLKVVIAAEPDVETYVVTWLVAVHNKIVLNHIK
jgi:hypothetical protein